MQAYLTSTPCSGSLWISRPCHLSPLQVGLGSSLSDQVETNKVAEVTIHQGHWKDFPCCVHQAG